MVSCGRIIGLCTALIACGDGGQDTSARDGSALGDATVPSPDGQSPDSAVGSDDGGVIVNNLAPATVDGTTIRVGPIPAEAGEERVMCVVVDLGNATPLYVRELSTHLNPGSHHMIVYRTVEPVSPKPTPCGSDIQDERMLFIAQAKDSMIRYPDPAALVLEAHQHVKIEIHYFNDTAGSLDIGSTVQFAPHEGDTAGLLPVKTRFTGEFTLRVPPGTSSATTFIDMAADSHYFAVTTHTHRWGVRSTLQRASSSSDPKPTLLHESLSWSEPPLTQLKPPITFGSDGLILTCNYDNLSSETVNFGTGARDEMCFFWGYYY